jgi:16S rRNA (uracil1498-N3)-methyltransferase
MVHDEAMKERKAKHRLYAPSLDGRAVELSASEAHHALHVLRLREGDEVELFDGAGGVARGGLRPSGRKAAAVEVAGRRSAARPEPVVELAFACPKGKRLDWLIEKATELGAARLTLVVFSRSASQPSAHALERLGAICIAAAKQCGANFLPQVARPVELGDFLAANQAGLRLLASAEAKTSLPSALTGYKRGEGITALIGPAGGLTDAETAAAVEAGFVPVRLGDLTLRVETAAAATLAAVTAFLAE